MDTNSCIIIGNGPSLRDVPREFLDQYPTFGANHIYLLPYQPTYYVCVDSVVLDNFKDEILPTVREAERVHLPVRYTRYSPWNCMKNVYPIMVWIAGEHCMSGHTVTYVSLKIALYEGFDTAFLVGVDHTTDTFDPKYPKAYNPMMESREYHYRLVADAWKAQGRRIVNMSAPSVLDEIFNVP